MTSCSTWKKRRPRLWTSSPRNNEIPAQCPDVPGPSGRRAVRGRFLLPGCFCFAGLAALYPRRFHDPAPRIANRSARRGGANGGSGDGPQGTAFFSKPNYSGSEIGGSFAGGSKEIRRTVDAGGDGGQRRDARKTGPPL